METETPRAGSRICLIELGEPRLEQTGRKQWVHYFEDVASVVYCTSLGDYDQVLADHPREVPDVYPYNDSSMLTCVLCPRLVYRSRLYSSSRSSTQGGSADPL